MNATSPHADSVAALWSELSAPLRRYIRTRIANAADAEDVLQEVFIRVHRQLSTLRDTSKLQGWVYRIARNAIIDNLRTLKSRREHAASPEDGVDIAKPSGSEALDLTPTLRRMVDELPGHYRDALIRHEFEGQPIRSLATSLGISETATKSRVRRARMLIRQMLDQCCRFEFDRRGRVIEAIPKNCPCTPGKAC